MTENAYKFVNNLTWANISEEWDLLFKKAYNKAIELREEIGRGRGKNESCYCGSGLKYKHCHGKNYDKTNTKS